MNFIDTPGESGKPLEAPQVSSNTKLPPDYSIDTPTETRTAQDHDMGTDVSGEEEGLLTVDEDQEAKSGLSF